MPTNVLIPSLGDSVSEAVLLRWLKNDGDYVKSDELLCELETDKANVDLPAPAAGVLRRAKSAGETVQVGETIARIDEAAVPAATVSEGKSAVAAGEEKAAGAAASDAMRPSVRRLAEEGRVDLASVEGSGPRGQIIKEDVMKAIDSRERPNGKPESDGPPAPAKPAPARVAPQPSLQHAAPLPATTTGPSPLSFDANGISRVPMSKWISPPFTLCARSTRSASMKCTA
jgi:2-oxoglutarate dehydrogenase E2 component (dihydrolipoamide succinyltransferase)